MSTFRELLETFLLLSVVVIVSMGSLTLLLKDEKIKIIITKTYFILMVVTIILSLVYGIAELILAI